MSSCHLGVWQESQLSGEDYWEGEGDHSTSQPYPGGAHAQDKPADDKPTAKKKREIQSKSEKWDLAGEKLGEGDVQGSSGSLEMTVAISEIDLRWVQKISLREKWSSCFSAKVYDSIIFMHLY